MRYPLSCRSLGKRLIEFAFDICVASSSSCTLISCKSYTEHVIPPVRSPARTPRISTSPSQRALVSPVASEELLKGTRLPDERGRSHGRELRDSPIMSWRFRRRQIAGQRRLRRSAFDFVNDHGLTTVRTNERTLALNAAVIVVRFISMPGRLSRASILSRRSVSFTTLSRVGDSPILVSSAA